MRITLDIPEKDLQDILRYSGENEEGAAVAKMLTLQLMLRRRRELSEKPMIEKLHAALPDWAQPRVADGGAAHWQDGPATVSPTL
jgi:hypothetical protein